MTLLEDINSGKYNLILFGIIFILLFNQHCTKSTENMTIEPAPPGTYKERRSIWYYYVEPKTGREI